MARTLDRSTPYGEIFGFDPEGRRFEQNGTYSDGAGDEVAPADGAAADDTASGDVAPGDDLSDPDVQIDTNHLERALRAIPLGRKNWPATSFGQVNVIISDGFSAAYREVLPEFE